MITIIRFEFHGTSPLRIVGLSLPEWRLFFIDELPYGSWPWFVGARFNPVYVEQSRLLKSALLSTPDQALHYFLVHLSKPDTVMNVAYMVRVNCKNIQPIFYDL